MKSLKNKKCFLFDIDGTLAVGNTLFEGSAPLLNYISSIGGKSFFITNNSTKSNRDYVEKFHSQFGLSVTEDQFITSGYMTLNYLKEHYRNKLIYVLGTASYITQLQSCQLHVTDHFQNDIACVVVAYDSELTYEKLVTCCRILSTLDVPFYGTNPDLCCPIDFGFIPDCGAICNMITASVQKEPIYLGKPNPIVVEACLKNSGFSKEETLVVGDRLYTDIACGINAGVDTCVVFTGEATGKDLINSQFTPDHTFSNIMELYQAVISARESIS